MNLSLVRHLGRRRATHGRLASRSAVSDELVGTGIGSFPGLDGGRRRARRIWSGLFCADIAPLGFAERRRLFRHCPGPITVDFSHWVCVSKSFLEGHEDFVSRAVKCSAHVYVRVGRPQSPQVTHPAPSENPAALQKHCAWWDAIVAGLQANSDENLTITTEFEPVPYMPTLSFTNQAVGDQFEINVWMLGV